MGSRVVDVSSFNVIGVAIAAQAVAPAVTRQQDIVRHGPSDTLLQGAAIASDPVGRIISPRFEGMGPEAVIVLGKAEGFASIGECPAIQGPIDLDHGRVDGVDVEIGQVVIWVVQGSV